MNKDINEFYMLKKKYGNNKKNRCFNCNREPGAKFKIEYFEDKRKLVIECGHEVEPCDLKKEISIQKDFNTEEHLENLISMKRNIEDEILKLKNKLLYELINDEDYNKNFTELNKEFISISKEIETRENNLDKIKNEGKDLELAIKTAIEENIIIENTNDRIENLITKVYPIGDLYKQKLEIVKEEEKKGVNKYKLDKSKI